MKLVNTIKEAFSGYAAMTIQQRAITDVRDNIKPSARMCFFAQKEAKIDSSHTIQPSPASVGECIKNYYLHGDSSCYKLCPQFLKENRLCWLRAPLFIETKNNKRYYYYSEREKQEKYRGGTIISAKGLGSMSADEMEEAMFTEENQKLDVLEYEPEVDKLLEDLMGEDVLPRKEFIFENIDFSKYMEY